MSGSPALKTDEVKPAETKLELLPEKKAEKPLVSVAMGNKGVLIGNMDEAARFCDALIKSGFVPDRFKTTGAVFSAIQMGAELGFTPIMALRSIAVINGTPSIYGDAALALVRKSGLLEDYSEEITGEGDKRKATVSSKRKGMPNPFVSQFSVEDAKLAKLWGKQGPWTQYPERMLKLRARGFNLRDNFADVLGGFPTAEEAEDYPIDGEDKTGPKLTE